MKTKTFDCVKMKQQGAEQVQAKLEGKTRDEQLEYWRIQTEALLQRQEKLKKSITGSYSTDGSSYL
ncbi:MAG: hypothetical protein C4527_04175 [Candidatus Omnitrophota bacterium]|jgi:hypothetical protein|nr:MAG: hypothetical protein C4527_04175 [Candidatus Omnitrophota bacterium]